MILAGFLVFFMICLITAIVYEAMQPWEGGDTNEE